MNWPLVMPFGIMEIGQPQFSWMLVTYSTKPLPDLNLIKIKTVETNQTSIARDAKKEWAQTNLSTVKQAEIWMDSQMDRMKQVYLIVRNCWRGADSRFAPSQWEMLNLG